MFEFLNANIQEKYFDALAEIEKAIDIVLSESGKTKDKESSYIDTEATPAGKPAPMSQPELLSIQNKLDEAEEKPYLDLTPNETIPLKEDKTANLFACFCNMVLDRLDNSKSKIEEWKRITSDFNQGLLVPELFKLKGKRCERALRGWVSNYQKNFFDMYSLIHGSINETKNRKVTFAEQNYLLSLLLSPNRVKIGTAIRNLKQMSNLKLLDSPSSKSTLLRWCMDWEADHPAEWSQARNGSKFVSENIIKSIMRDDSLLSVGDVWVADGHKLAFDIINPITGRPQRMTLIMFFDWASRYPVGASIAVTEDTQHIAIALRNGILNWGGLPKYVYLDNGKAFRSKLFNERWEDHDLATEIGGIFPRLNIGVSFAQKYNARSKVIERFFKTFQEQFERFISTFRGASIADKPATLMRNEKWAKKLFEGKATTVEEAVQMMSFYFRYAYGETPHGGLNQKKPFQLFSTAEIPEDRKIEASKLNFLMLAVERKAVRSEGIRLNHMIYWQEALIDHIGQPVVIRYDYSDARWILVYTKNDKFICQAELRRAQHPFIHLDKNNAIAHRELKREYDQIKKLQRKTEQRTKELVKNTQKIVDGLIKPAPINEVPITMFNNPPMIEAPVKQLTVDEIADNALKSIQNMEVITRVETKHETPEPVAEFDNASEPEITTPQIKTKSFEEMLKAIGIK